MAERTYLISEALSDPPEEGVRRIAHELARRLPERTASESMGPADAPAGSQPLLRGRLPGLSALRAVRRFRPDRVVYVPYHGMTRAGWIRLAMIAAAAPRARIVVIFVQPVPQESALARTFARMLRRRIVFLTGSPDCLEVARGLGVRAEGVAFGVDTERFSPVSDGERAALRAARGYGEDSTVVLHVGHPTPGRRLDRVVGLAAEGFEVVLALSSSTEWGGAEYLPSGDRVTVHHGYVADIEDLYRVADVYVFPVDDVAVHAELNARAAIGTPLSVLEALACGTPVVSTPFGALPGLLEGRPDVVFVEADQDFAPAVRKLASVRATEPVPAWGDLVEKVLSA